MNFVFSRLRRDIKKSLQINSNIPHEFQIEPDVCFHKTTTRETFAEFLTFLHVKID